MELPGDHKAHQNLIRVSRSVVVGKVEVLATKAHNDTEVVIRV